MEVAIIRSFTNMGSDESGNPAGVILDMKKTLSESEMQSIATRIGVSETAFVSCGTQGADFDLRFFTPTDEVPLCGHATIAAFWYLHHEGVISKGTYKQHTFAGILPVEVQQTVEGETLISMLQTEPKRCSESLDFDSDFSKSFPNVTLNQTLPIEIWSTGLLDILLPINSRNALNEMKVDFNALSSLSEKFNVVGVHAFAIENAQIFARNFAPLYGIDEESATGTSNGALVAYLNHHVKSDSFNEIVILQGENMGQLSKIYVRYSSHPKPSVWVGGNATLVASKIL